MYSNCVPVHEARILDLCETFNDRILANIVLNPPENKCVTSLNSLPAGNSAAKTEF